MDVILFCANVVQAMGKELKGGWFVIILIFILPLTTGMTDQFEYDTSDNVEIEAVCRALQLNVDSRF